LQGSLVWQTDRPTDHATQSVTIGRIYYVRSTAMRPKSCSCSLCWIVQIKSGITASCWYNLLRCRRLEVNFYLLSMTRPGPCHHLNIFCKFGLRLNSLLLPFSSHLVFTHQQVIKEQAASPSHMDGSMVFTRWRQCAPPPNTCFLGPTQVQIPSGISISSAVLAQIMAQRPYTLQ